jgi:hypothetical protein
VFYNTEEKFGCKRFKSKATYSNFMFTHCMLFELLDTRKYARALLQVNLEDTIFLVMQHHRRLRYNSGTNYFKGDKMCWQLASVVSLLKLTIISAAY